MIMPPREPSSVDYDELRRFVAPHASGHRRAPPPPRATRLERLLDFAYHALRHLRMRVTR
jgi:hypothetical protein